MSRLGSWSELNSGIRDVLVHLQKDAFFNRLYVLQYVYLWLTIVGEHMQLDYGWSLEMMQPIVTWINWITLSPEWINSTSFGRYVVFGIVSIAILVGILLIISLVDRVIETSSVPAWMTGATRLILGCLLAGHVMVANTLVSLILIPDKNHAWGQPRWTTALDVFLFIISSIVFIAFLEFLLFVLNIGLRLLASVIQLFDSFVLRL